MPAPDHLDMRQLRQRVAAYRPRAAPADDPGLWAATALVVAPSPGRALGAAGHDPAVAFIRRPVRADDRWSGQMALPGGKRDPDDDDAVAAAVREAAEEVGVVLPPPVGRLDDVHGRVWAGTVATFVFVLDHRPPLRPHPAEVAAALWIPVRSLLSAEAAHHHRLQGSGVFPAIRHGDDVIWGLTHRIISSFAEALGVALPRRPGDA